MILKRVTWHDEYEIAALKDSEIKVNFTVISQVGIHSLDMMWWEYHFSVVFLPQTYNPHLSMKKISDKPKSRDTLQDTLPVLLKTITVMKHKQD